MNEDDLRRRLRSTETTFVERKRVSDLQDLAKTVVAFANTLRPDQAGVIFVGAADNGDIEDHGSDLDNLQKKFVERTKNIYPQCPYFEMHEVREDEKACLAIVVPGGPDKPYFTGPPYFRRASTSSRATLTEYEQLMATRSGKAHELQQWIGKSVTVRNVVHEPGVARMVWSQQLDGRIESCNQFYVTVSFGSRKESYPLTKIDIAYDHSTDRLQLERETFERS